MDCIQAMEVLSRNVDSTDVTPEELAAAYEHCDECAECGRLRATIIRIASLPPGSAPADLKDRLHALAAEEAAVIRAERAAASAITSVTEKHRFSTTGWPRRRVTLFAAAAALVTIAVIGTAIGLGTFGPRTALDGGVANLESSGADAPMAAAPETHAADDSKVTDGYAADPPSYVSLQGRVFRLEGPGAAPSSPTTAGIVTTRLDGDVVRELIAFTPPGDTSALALEHDGAWLYFRSVERTFGRSAFQLVTGTPVSGYGQWPDVPPRFAPPASPDGSPTFRFFGKDDLGVDVYVPVGSSAADGFAIAPNTAPDDPAAGNPGWTWWEPAP